MIHNPDDDWCFCGKDRWSHADPRFMCQRETTPPDDITRRRLDRGEVKCEACGAWTATYAMTVDDCYLCPPCAAQTPKATEEELREYGIID